MVEPYYKFMCLCQVGHCEDKATHMVYKQNKFETNDDLKVPIYYFCDKHIQREVLFLEKIYNLKDMVLGVVKLKDIESGKEYGW